MQNQPGSLCHSAGRGVIGFCLVSIVALSLTFEGQADAETRGVGSLPVPATSNDFLAPGTDPNTVIDIFANSGACTVCHAGYDLSHEPGRWRGSMHALAGRDPIFRAAVEIANQDVNKSGELCFKCHVPKAWLEGRVADVMGGETGSGVFPAEIADGITCHVCHRMVDPIYEMGVSPPDDLMIIQALGQGNVPMEFGNAEMVIDPLDVRRGPFDFPPQGGFEPPHDWAYSPFHSSGDQCGTCHDVSNPVLIRSGSDYVVDTLDAPHSTQSKFDMFPEQRTYSEWLNSTFANGGVPYSDPQEPYDLAGRFGANTQTTISTCQDCHMPDRSGTGCLPGFGSPQRDNVPYHSFQGANIFALDLVEHIYSDELGTADIDAIAQQRLDVRAMLEAASDIEVSQTACQLTVRVINQTGHKLPTGYPEGRRMWLNVQFLDDQDQLIAERGAYDPLNAELTTSDTKVYETKHGLDNYMSGQTGLPAGESFHLVLNNKILFDNRIPPRGFTNAAFAAVQAEPVGYTYADGQHWDDTKFLIPPGTAKVSVRLHYQTSSKEYIEFLEQANTGPAGNAGDILLAAWAAVGKSAPETMDEIEMMPLDPWIPGDLNGDGSVNIMDLNIVIGNFGTSAMGITFGDGNLDGFVDIQDLNLVLGNFGQSLNP